MLKLKTLDAFDKIQEGEFKLGAGRFEIGNF